MIFGFLSLGFSLIDQVTKEEIFRKRPEGHTFLLVVSSRSYSYASTIEMFVRSIRQSLVSARFLYIDVYSENLTPKDLHIPSVPGLIYLPCHQFFRGQMTESSLVAFFNECTASKIPYIRTSSELQLYFDTCAFGVLIAYANASDATLPAVAEIHRTHFNEISFAYCDPALTGTVNSFVYRFTDSTLVQIHKPLFNLSQPAVESLLLEYALPDFPKGDVDTLNFLQTRVSRLGVIVFNLNGGFYPSLEQIELGKQIAARCRIPVCYESLSLPLASSSLFQFPATAESEEFRIIDLSGSIIVKYRMIDKITIENMVAFYQKVQLGQVNRYLRSAPIPLAVNEEIDRVVALNALDYVGNGWAALGFYNRDDSSISGMIQAKPMVGTKCKIGAFDLASNEWPGEPIVFAELPRLVLFKDGAVKLNEPLAASPKVVVARILQEVTDRDL
jgi:hypothetical protein